MSAVVTPQVVRGWALGTIAEWLPGYTEPLEDGHQRKIKDVSYAEDKAVTIEVDKTWPFDEYPEVFVIDVVVVRRHKFAEGPPASGVCVHCAQVKSAAVHR